MSNITLEQRIQNTIDEIDCLKAENERLRAAGWAVVNSSHGAGAKHWAACEEMRTALKETKP
jgi:DNA-binding IclR family transcriptional regulator